MRFGIAALALLHGADAGFRGLQSTVPTRWEDCLGMTGEECKAHILSTVGGDLSNHPIPNLEIKINTQRPPEVLAASYWMFGVPTNMFGEMDCDLNEGKSIFPFVWQASDGTSYAIPDVECNGLDALACCDAVEKMMIDEGIPLTNSDGNCFSCWVHQEPLKPALDPATGLVVYKEHAWDAAANKCVESSYTQSEVQANDAQVTSKLIGVRAKIKDILLDEDGLVNCGDIKSARSDVLLHGRSFPKAMAHISGLLCGQCEGADSEQITLTIDQHEALQFVQRELTNPVKSDENCIVIYTDHKAEKVLKVPQVGGSRNDKLPSEPIVEPDGGSGVVDTVCEAPLMDDGQGGCMCQAVTDIADNQVYWMGGGLVDTSISGCSCPSELLEYNSRCFCPGGYKIWDTSLSKCVCPHGTEADGSCICPGPNSGMDWNNVGWIDNGASSCRVDYDCILSGYDYYSTFEGGCDRCRWGYQDDGYGNCVKPCDRSMGLVFDPVKDKCVCMYADHVFFNGECQCEALGATIPPGETQCMCTPPEVMLYDEGSKSYYCNFIPPGGENPYYNYGFYH